MAVSAIKNSATACQCPLNPRMSVVSHFPNNSNIVVRPSSFYRCGSNLLFKNLFYEVTSVFEDTISSYDCGAGYA